MNKIENYLLFLVLLFFTACANNAEPGEKNVMNTETKEAQQEAHPMYQTSKCKGVVDIDEKRMCSDKQLLKEIQEIITKHQKAKQAIKGTKIILEFDIPINGKATNVAVKRGVDSELDKAVAVFLSRTNWSPAIHDGKKVQITRRLPIYVE